MQTAEDNIDNRELSGKILVICLDVIGMVPMMEYRGSRDQASSAGTQKGKANPFLTAAGR